MNEDSPHDIELNALAARLAARPPQISPQQRDDILYASAFASGRNASARSLRIWKSTAAVLSLLLVGAVVSPMHAPPQIADRPEEPAVPVEIESPIQSNESLPVMVAQKTQLVNLDAWQVPTSPHDRLNEQLAKWSQSGPHLRSMTFSSLTRTFLAPENTDSL